MNDIDIEEDNILKSDCRLLAILLEDNSSKQNIIWATDNYTSLGESYASNGQILQTDITGINGMIICPRFKKIREEQISRVKEKAEVFTPSWLCNKQNNLIDNAWFGRENIFNIERENGWDTLLYPIAFPTKDGKTWQDYVNDVRLEITCGEAPYLVSRYDAISGQFIPVQDRIGLLDRKLRVVSENTQTEDDWYQWATIAFQCIYGYEWQGDSLLLARENLLFSFIDYYKTKFNKMPTLQQSQEIARIISWNIWQMDGLKGVIPNSCKTEKVTIHELFGTKESVCECEGCKKDDIHKHNGIYCKIKDWKTGETLKFVSLIKKNK